MPPQWATTEAVRRGAKGPKGQNYSHDNLLKKTELKAALTGSTGRAKGSPPKKHNDEKGKSLTLFSNLEVAEGSDVRGDEVDDE